MTAMKTLLDLAPLGVFFYYVLNYDIYQATGALMIAMTIQVVLLRMIYQSVEKPTFLGWILVMVLGALTLVFRNPEFILWKPTVVNWVMAGVFIVTPMISGHSPLEHLLKGKMKLPANIWLQLNRLWVGFFIIVGGLNLWVAYHFSIETWASFKVFGLTALYFLFVLIQGLFIAKHIEEVDESR